MAAEGRDDSAKLKSFLYQHVGADVAAQKAVLGLPQSIHKDMEETELLWSSWRAGLLTVRKPRSSSRSETRHSSARPKKLSQTKRDRGSCGEVKDVEQHTLQQHDCKLAGEKR